MTAPGISSTDFCRAAGITYRTLDYWVRAGYLSELIAATGSGSRRRMDPDLAPAVANAVRISKAFDQHHRGALAGHMLRKIIDAYAVGGIQVTDDAWLVWNVHPAPP